MGLLTARLLAARGWTVVATGRDLSEISEADQRHGIRPMSLDLNALASADDFVDAVRAADLPPIRALVCNAGFQNPDQRWSDDGFEATVAVNYLSQLRLVDRLVPHLAPDARIVWTASGTHDPDEVRMLPPAWESATLEELVHPEPVAGRSARLGYQRYATSKLCVVRAIPRIARDLAGTATVNAFDPGLMPGTGLARAYPRPMQVLASALTPLLLLTPGSHRPSTSARHLADLVTSPRFEKMTGAYVVDDHPAGTSIASMDAAESERFYQESLALVGATSLGTGHGGS